MYANEKLIVSYQNQFLLEDHSSRRAQSRGVRSKWTRFFPLSGRAKTWVQTFSFRSLKSFSFSGPPNKVKNSAKSAHESWTINWCEESTNEWNMLHALLASSSCVDGVPSALPGSKFSRFKSDMNCLAKIL